MLTWVADEPQLIGKLGGQLGPEDFTDPLCRKVAEALWEQAKAGKVDPAAILERFPEEEDQVEAASMFHAMLELDRSEDRAEAFYDVFCRMKRESLELRAAALDPSDLAAFAEITEERKKLERMQREGPPPGLFDGTGN